MVLNNRITTVNQCVSEIALIWLLLTWCAHTQFDLYDHELHQHLPSVLRRVAPFVSLVAPLPHFELDAVLWPSEDLHTQTAK
jgi:hypothetical protein